jgi:hypothetical protein
MTIRLASAGLLAAALVVAACGSSSDTAPPAPLTTAVPGNSVAVALPTDAPAVVLALPPLPSCGAEILFEEDVDIKPIPTPPGPTTAPSANKQATDCLESAWENGASAELRVSQVSDEADEIFSIYRLPGDGSVQLIVRVLSHSDKTIAWTQTTCQQLSVQDGVVTPASCQSETPIG